MSNLIKETIKKKEREKETNQFEIIRIENCREWNCGGMEDKDRV